MVADSPDSSDLDLLNPGFFDYPDPSGKMMSESDTSSSDRIAMIAGKLFEGRRGDGRLGGCR